FFFFSAYRVFFFCFFFSAYRVFFFFFFFFKISFIKQFQEQQAATARRQATPVVGDLRPLADALPELCQLRPLPTPTLLPVKRTEPTDFSQMKQSQKRKLLETETSRFSDAIKSLATKTNPLADIGEQLRKRMRQEEEQGPS
uniref:Family with sequence similarity 207 member A n=1 Tax=Sphaeramia orbicularis TaxID=375764 RepID=A0A673A9H6_9TELE